MKTRTSRQDETIRMFAMFFLHHLESLGFTAERLRQSAGLAEDWLDVTGAELVALLPRILKAGQQLTGDDLLCLHAGDRFHFCLAGLGGFAAVHAPTAALALETFGQFVSADDILDVSVSAALDETVFAVDVVASWPKPLRDQMADGFASCLVAALRAVCGMQIAPIRAKLARAKPAEPQEFARVLRCEVEFGAPRNELVFKPDDLVSTSPLYDAMLYEQLRFMSDLRTERPSGAGPLRQLVEQALRGGAHTIEGVAGTLQMGTRALQRRLQTEGVTFRRILSHVRVDMAKQLLLETSLSLPEIAQRLNYTDDKALRKAIKRETGLTPSELRRQGVQQAPPPPPSG